MMAQPNYNLDIQLPSIFVSNKPSTPPTTVPDYRYSYPYYLPPVYRSPEPNMIQTHQQTQVQHQTQAHLQPQAHQMQQSMSMPTTHQQLQTHLQPQPYSSQMLHPYQNIQPHPQQQQQQQQHQHQQQQHQQHQSLQQQHQHHQQQMNHPVQIQHKEPFKIDYSSLVSYTVSPSLKRKRRKKVDTPITESNFSCNICLKSFQKPYNLKSHMKTHSNDKPFKCPKCFKTFARSHDKKRHELLHDGIKNFKCEGYLKDGKTKWGCGKKFARSDALSRHFRTETGWLCILPLMDEAKKDKDGSFEQEYMDNSNFIKKLIQG